MSVSMYFFQGATIVNQVVTITDVDHFPEDANTQTSAVRELIPIVFNVIFKTHMKYVIRVFIVVLMMKHASLL